MHIVVNWLQRRAVWQIATLLLLASTLPGTPAAASVDHEWAPLTATTSTTVVFVHGVLGDSVTSFGESLQKGWPALLASEKDRSVRVLSLGYNSPPLSAASNISELANRLRSRLADKQVFGKDRKVVFIAHSMGGLITKRMLVQLAAESREAFDSVAGVFFMATPAGGSDLAALATWMSGNPQFRDMRPRDVNTLLQVMEDDWQSLLRKRPATRPYPLVFCAYEKIGMGPGKVVVPRSQSQAGCDETPIAFDLDHATIVKPKGRADEVYQYVGTRLAKLQRDDYVSLAVRAEIVDRAGRVLSEPLVLYTSDTFAVKVSLSKPAWVYVFGEDSTGKVERYFPTDASGRQLRPETAVRIPGDPTKLLQLDKNKGVDRLYIFATSAPNDQVSRLHEEIAKQGSAAKRQRLERELTGRGAFVVSDTVVNALKVKRFNPGSIGAEAATQLVIEHR